MMIQGEFYHLVISAAGGKSGDFASSIGAPICLGKTELSCREDKGSLQQLGF